MYTTKIGFVFSLLRYTEYIKDDEEDAMEEREKKVAAAALLIVAGGIIGAGLALLFAPQTGQRTRKDILRYAKKTRNRAGESVDDLSANICDLVESISDKTDDLVEKGKGVAGSARKDLIRLIEEGASKLEQFRTKLSRM
jgi:gas vesicle protein